jgi:hypothetical protein
VNQPQEQPVHELEVVVLEDKKPGSKGGRPLKLTPRRFANMLEHIRSGHTNSAACAIEGLTYSSWRDHIQRNPEWRARVAEAEAERDELRRDKALETLQAAFPKTWVAAAWYLERRHPDFYALKTVHRNLNSNEQPVGDAIPESRLLEYSKQMAEFARANEQGPRESADGNGT